MTDINHLLTQILSAVYGKDVRQSIHDAIQQCYTDNANPRYYKPSVQSNGVLTWIRSHSDLPGISAVNIKGATGKTPIKGVDYWTASDKNEMLQHILNSSDLVNLITNSLPAKSDRSYTIRVVNTNEDLSPAIVTAVGEVEWEETESAEEYCETGQVTAYGNTIIYDSSNYDCLAQSPMDPLGLLRTLPNKTGTYVYVGHGLFHGDYGSISAIYINDVEVTLDDFIETGDDLFPYAYKVSDAPGGITRPSDASHVTISMSEAEDYNPTVTIEGSPFAHVDSFGVDCDLLRTYYYNISTISIVGKPDHRINVYEVDGDSPAPGTIINQYNNVCPNGVSDRWIWNVLPNNDNNWFIEYVYDEEVGEEV